MSTLMALPTLDTRELPELHCHIALHMNIALPLSLLLLLLLWMEQWNRSSHGHCNDSMDFVPGTCNAS